MALKHKTKLPSDPRKLNPEVSENLSRLILICMEKDRERRYQTAEALLNDLQNIEEGLPLGTKIKPRRATFTQTLIRRKLLIPAFIILAIAIIALLIWRLLPKKEAVPLSPTGKPSVAILYFDNFSGDESLDNWRFAFPELLITDLSQSKYIRVLRLDEINSVLNILNLTDTEKYSLENLKDISEKCRANHLLKGSYIKAGDTFKITATLISGITAETISSLNVEAEGERDIYVKVDDLTKEIKQNLGIAPNQLADDIDMEIGNVTTQNVEALHYYIEGERYHYNYEYDKAIQSFKKAVDIDPEFAMAYRMLGACYSNKGLTEEWKNAFQKAYQLKDRLPIRERYILEGDFYLIDGFIHMDENDYLNAIEMYKKVVELYPDYYLGNHMLAMMYMRIGDWDRAIEYRSKQIQNKTSMFLPYNLLAEDYSIKGEYDESVKVWEEAFKNIQKDLDLALAHEFLARVHLQESKYDLALSELDKALSIYSHPWIKADVERCKADILYFNDNMDEALKKYQGNPKYLEWMEPWMLIVNVYVSQGKMKKAIDLHNDKLQSLLKQKQTSGNKNWIRIIQESLACLHIKTGEPELALEKLKKAYTLIDEDYPYQSQRKLNLFYQALAYIEMNQFDEALNTIEENKRVWPAIVKKSVRGDFKADIFFLKGKSALRRENIKEAIINLEKAVSLLPGEIFSYEYWVHGFHALYIDSLAFAYLKNGDIDLAIENYEKIHNLTYGRFIWGDIYAKSFYTLGKLYQDKGWKGKAIESYKRFIKLWKDCAPHFQSIVEDAKKILAGLKSNNHLKISQDTEK